MNIFTASILMELPQRQSMAFSDQSLHSQLKDKNNALAAVVVRCPITALETCR